MGPVFRDTCQVATVVTETAQLVLSQFRNFLTFAVVSRELNNVSRSLATKNNQLVGLSIVNW